MAEIQSAQPPAIPSWVMMDQHFRFKNPSSFRADGDTSAETLDTNGKPVRVSFDLQSLPGSSRLCLHCPEERPPFGWELIVAAHDDAVLFRIEVDFDGLPVNRGCAMDYFIYRACSPSSGPKLTLLPRCYSTDAEVRESDGASWRRQWRMVNSSGIGIYATEEGSLVAELGIQTWSAKDKTAPLEAELFKLFSPSSPVSANGGGQWELKLARSRGNKVRFQDIVGWYTHKVVPYSSYLCWADYNQGVLLCDVMDTNPDLQYAKLPVDDTPREEFPTFSRTICVTNKYQTMKFVKVSNMPSCPNCKPGPSFTISVWTLNNKGYNEWEWVQDANITASDLWAMEGYHQDLPCSVPQFPLVSMDDPHILYFVVTGTPASGRPALSEGTIWIVTLNIKSNTVLNSHDINGFPLDSNIFSGFGFFPSNFTSYLKKHSSEIKEHIKKTKDEKNAKKAEVNNVQKSQGKGAVQKGSKGLKLGGGGGKR